MSLSIRTMHSEDIDRALELCRAAGWNQVRADWEYFVANATCIVATDGERVAGTCTVLFPCGPLAWIAMLLVDPSVRRQSIASRLFTCTLDTITAPTTGLDATPEGRPLYERFGFSPSHEIVRWRRPPAALNPPAAAPPCRWRKGHDSHHIGPLVAGSVDEASNQVLSCLAIDTDRSWILDVPATATRAWQNWLANTGFVPRRTFVRMYRGPIPPSNPDLYATSGPEFPDMP